MRMVLATIAAGLIAFGASTGMAQDVEGLAKSLAADPKPQTPSCPKKLPDGSCPDTVDTRQMRLPGSAPAVSAAVTSVSHAIRADISMTFIKGSAELTAAAKATLDRFAKSLVSVGNYRPFTVEGHTDRSGSREVNLTLSKARADSVVQYLAANGVDRSKP